MDMSSAELVIGLAAGFLIGYAVERRRVRGEAMRELREEHRRIFDEAKRELWSTPTTLPPEYRRWPPPPPPPVERNRGARDDDK